MSLIEPATGFEPGKKLADRTSCRSGVSLAILELIRRQSRGEKLRHREVGVRFGVKTSTLKTAFCRWKKGQITLKGFDRPEDLLTDERGDLIKDLARIRALKDGLNGMIARVVDAAGAAVGQMTDADYKSLGVGKIIKDLRDLEKLLDFKRRALVRLDREDAEVVDFVRQVRTAKRQKRRLEKGEPISGEKAEPALNVANALEALK